jgi:HEPN domain-containing protein
MNGEIEQWIEKAEGDFEGALQLAKGRSARTAHLLCFACQQSAEKYLKVFLADKNIHFSKTHDLEMYLLPLCETVDAEFKILTEYVKNLDPYAVEFRYPGEQIENSEVDAALDAAKRVRQFVREKLGLEPQQRFL